MTTEEVQKIINAGAEADSQAITVFERMRSALERFDGKRLTRRMRAAAAEDEFTEYRVYCSDEYSFYRLNLYRINAPIIDPVYSFILGTKDDPIFRLSDFDNFNASYGRAAHERNAQRADDIKRAAAIAHAITCAQNVIVELKRMIYDGQIVERYTILKAAGIKTEIFY